jgi:signal transduction histidine kinase
MNKPIEKNKLRFYYYIGSISSILLVVVLLSVIYSKSLNQEYKTKINQLSSSITSEKKRFLRNAVERTISLIETEREQVRNSPSLQHLSMEEQDDISLERIERRIRDIRLIDDGYLWVNRIVKYQGGDNYAIRQIHPNLPDTEGEWLSTNTTDIKGNRPYEVELNGINKSGEIFFDYYFKKMKSDTIAHKMTFAKLYKPWNWVVATGVYLDDVDQLVQIETEKMKATLKKQQLYSSAIALLVISISVLILIRFEKQISQLIQAYEKDTQKFTEAILQENTRAERALEEIKQLKGIIPICMYCKEIRDDEGAWNRLEEYIETHSDAQFSHGICEKCMEEKFGK